MPLRIRTLLAMVAATVALLVAASPASAVNFEPSPGTYTVDTTAMTITGPGTSISGVDQGGVAVFSFDNVSIPLGVALVVDGTRPFKLVAAGAMAVAGTIEGSGSSAENFNDPDFVPGRIPGGPGGGAGGANATEPGEGPGAGGIASNTISGGGGGGFGGVGAKGGNASGGTGGAGGAAYGNLNAVLQGGSGGAGASAALVGQSVGGGGGGGAIALFGSSVRLTLNAVVIVEGGGGAVGNNGASGGGSGGGILIHGDTVQVDGVLLAGGGDGGKGGCCGAGGGGGGGRIAIQYGRSLSFTGFTDVSGGTSGARQSQGSFGTGFLGDPAGADGIVTKIQGASATTAAATAITSKGATLNGTVTPTSGGATTYYFEYGTTPAYGSKVPVPNGSVGASPQAVAQAISGLKPNVTYHYRLVANGLGFTSPGADVAFKTPACIVPKLKGKKTKAAKKALKKAGCKPGKVKKAFSSKVKKGRVIKQGTKPKKVLPAGAKVGIRVSKGEKEG